MKILIVDDSKASRMIVKRALRQAGLDNHTLEEAGDGAEALNMITQAAPDIVLCDWNMPEMSGIELLEALNAKGIQLKFGFVTSEGTDDMKQRARDAGSLFFISKPITPEKFSSTLQPLLGG